MTVTTSKGRTFEAEWIDGPVGENGAVILQLRDARALSEIARDFEGCERVHRASESQGDADYDGYTQLVSIFRVHYEQDAVRLTLEKSK